MKKLSFLIAFLVVGFSAQAASTTADDRSYPSVYGEPFIFVERGVEFAVFPDGQFDFFYNPRGFSVNVHIPNVNISYNAGYNYDPYIQYDDYGAVIQIEDVPVYYDYYGRIIQAGNIQIVYNNFGRIARIGGLYIHYNPHNQYTHYSGFINRYNKAYFYRPWHRYYIQPHAHHVVVYHQPYRTHYYPHRVTYSYYRDYYRTHYNNGFKKRYYNPGEQAVVYHRGTRTESRRDLDARRTYSDYSSFNNVRSNANTQKDRNVRQVNASSRSKSSSDNVRTSPNRSTESPSNIRNSRNSSRIGNTQSSSTQRTSNARTTRGVTQEKARTVNSRSTPSDAGERSATTTTRRDTRSSNVGTQRSQPAARSQVKSVERSSGASTNRGASSRSSRGRE